MRSLKYLIGSIVTAIALLGCTPSNDTIAKQVRELFQQKLSAQAELKDYGLTVTQLDVIHETGNKYQGMAKVMMKGVSHDVPMAIVADGDKVMYEVSPAALAFVAQEAMKQAMSDAQAQIDRAMAVDTAALSEPKMPLEVKDLTDKVDALNDLCRGSAGDDTVGQKACDERDKLGAVAKENGWCWGHKDDAGYQRKWVPCAPGDA